MRFIATFGVIGRNSGKYVIVHASTETIAISKMTDWFGSDWGMLYATEDGAGVTRWGLTLLREIS